MIANDPEVTAIRTSADDETDETDATTQNAGTGTDVIHVKLSQLNANNFLPMDLAKTDGSEHGQNIEKSFYRHASWRHADHKKNVEKNYNIIMFLHSHNLSIFTAHYRHLSRLDLSLGKQTKNYFLLHGRSPPLCLLHSNFLVWHAHVDSLGISTA